MKKPDLENIAFKLRDKLLTSDHHSIDDRIFEHLLESLEPLLSEWTEEVKEWMRESEEDGKSITREEWHEKYND